MKICCLVKEVPDAAVQKRIDPSTKRLDRSGEKNLNPFDTHGIEAAMQIREGENGVDVDEIVAVTMGPESSVRALHKAVALGADRSVHLTDDALAGSDVCATGYALAKVLEAEQPDLVLLGQQSDDGECYTIGAVVADHLKMPSLTQVIKIESRTASWSANDRRSTDTTRSRSTLPAVISVGDAINEPRYPSLKAIMGAKKKPLDTKAAATSASTRPRSARADRRRGCSRSTRLPPRRRARCSRTRTRRRRSRRSSPGSTKGS